MGAVVTVYIPPNSDPNHEAKIRALADQLQSQLGEPVDLDVGLLDNRSMPVGVELNRMLNDGTKKIRV